MTATVLPDIDYSKLEELRKRLPDLSDIELSPPRMEDVGKRAEEAVDRLLGRRRNPTWPWIAAAVGLVAVIGLLVAWLTLNRRSAWDGGSLAPRGDVDTEASLGGDSSFDLGTTGTAGAGMAAGIHDVAGEPAAAGSETAEDASGGTSGGTGLTAAEASLTSSRESDERG